MPRWSDPDLNDTEEKKENRFRLRSALSNELASARYERNGHASDRYRGNDGHRTNNETSIKEAARRVGLFRSRELAEETEGVSRLRDKGRFI